jgi:uncharacterized phiE125 gp8 family phage protein
MALVQTVASTVEPITLDELKNHLKLSTVITTEDALLNTYIQVARKQAENYMKRQIIDATWQLILSDFPADSRGSIELPRPPLTTIANEVSITYIDSSYSSTTLGSTFYTIDVNHTLPRIYPSDNSSNENRWSDLSPANVNNAVTVQYVSGYSSVNSTLIPAEIKQWIMMRCGMFYEYREPVTIDQYRQIPRTFMDGLLDGYTILTCT